MRYWLDTSGTIARGLGFSLFDLEHLFWLGLTVCCITVLCRYYRTNDLSGRVRLRHWVAAAIVANELFKTVMLFLGGNREPEYLPLHLCSVNVFLVAYHAWKPGKVLDNFLYAVCVPGAAAALLFPSWNKLPPINFMYLHSFTIHILLMAYPIMLTSGGEIRPDHRYIPKVLALLATLAVVALGANLIFDTNFMFLMKATKSSPLYFFQKQFGSHLVGFAVILPAVLGVMYAPWTRSHGKSTVPHLF